MSEDILREELAEIDKRIEEYKNDVETGKALERLHENEDFKNVIIGAYFDDEAKRVFELLTEPTNLKREQLENIEDKLKAIRVFKLFFKTLLINANIAPDQIDELEEYRKEVTSRPIDVDVVEDEE
jgi:hypothetical protein